jgi:hypothetical protein
VGQRRGTVGRHGAVFLRLSDFGSTA